ncbi:MAG: hypothetical protein J6M31_05810, partial [Bacteroidales bacterium]|nr:hypothetical protein [Bacteroidales bacterium]
FLIVSGCKDTFFPSIIIQFTAFFPATLLETNAVFQGKSGYLASKAFSIRLMASVLAFSAMSM